MALVQNKVCSYPTLLCVTYAVSGTDELHAATPRWYLYGACLVQTCRMLLHGLRYWRAAVASAQEVCSYGHVAYAPMVTSRMLLRSRRVCSYGHVAYAPMVTW
eukprot:3100681-Rhodomonas_salina.1